MKRVKITLLLLVIISMKISLIGCVILSDESVKWKRETWVEFKEEILNEYDYISEIEIYDNTILLSFHFTINREFTIDEAETVFKKVRSFILNKEVFIGLNKYHLEKNKGTLAALHIVFKEQKNEENYFVFYSESEDGKITKYDSFQTWSIRTKDTIEKYIP